MAPPRTAGKTASKRPAKPQVPAYAAALARLPDQGQTENGLAALRELENAFGFAFPQEAVRLMVGLSRFKLQGGAADPLSLELMRSFNALGSTPPKDVMPWATSRLGLWVVAADSLGNRLCVDLVDPSGLCPVYLCTMKMGLAAAATPLFPVATDLLHAFALYTLGAPAREAATKVETLEANLVELRKRRPGLNTGRTEAMARLSAAFGGGGNAAVAAPSAMDESRMSAELDAAKEHHKQLWMPFMEQFSKWHVYWRLLWNGANSLSFQTAVLDQPLVEAWRAVLPLVPHVLEGRVEALKGELAQRQPCARNAVAFAECYLLSNNPDAAESVLRLWDAQGTPRPPRILRLMRAPVEAATAAAATPWGAALKLSAKQADKFLHAVGAQFAADLKKHGTTNILGATKAAVRRDGHGRNIVEAGFGHVPLEVRKALFEGRPVELPGQFLKALTVELTRRLHQPAKQVEKTLTRLRLTVEHAINTRTPLTIPHVGTFRVKNEPAPTGQSRFYLLMDPAPPLVAAAQLTVIHDVSARPDEGFFLN